TTCERKNLSRIGDDDAVERGDESKESDACKNFRYATLLSEDDSDGFRQRVVDVGKLTPVGDAARQQHHPEREQHQRHDAGDVPFRNVAFRILHFFRNHSHAFDGEVEPDGEWKRGKYPLPLQREGVARKVAHAEMRPYDTHEHEQLCNREEGDDKREDGGFLDAEQVDQGEDKVADDRGGQYRDIWVQEVCVASECKGYGRCREDKFNDGSIAGNESAQRTKGFVAIGKRTTGVRDGSRQFGETEDERNVHQRYRQRCDKKPNRSGYAPSVVPSKVFSGDDQAHGDRPQVNGRQGLSETRGLGHGGKIRIMSE